MQGCRTLAECPIYYDNNEVTKEGIYVLELIHDTSITSQQRYHLRLVLADDFTASGATNMVSMSSELAARVGTYEDLLVRRDGMSLPIMLFNHLHHN